ncbi:MAG: hypothetical protein HFI51_12390 [Lachnospiraceae bacterium]|jgi:ribosomal protein L20A (L18A)|nr:hypothetical protein [Lachnospiraceae bacterium]
MSKIEGYGVYQNSYMGNTTQSRSTREAEKTEKTEKKEPVQLSDRAKKLLEEMKKTYSNMDFIVADYETEEEAAAYLSRGTKEFSTLIDPDTLEAMAADEEVKAKYTGILDDAVGQLKDIKEKLGDDNEDVTRVGISIDKNGQVSYFAELEKSGERQKEWIEKTREAKKEERAEQEKKAQEQKDQDIAAQGRTKKTLVQAGSVEELLEKIKNVDWNQIRSEEKPVTGGKFDFSI